MLTSLGARWFGWIHGNNLIYNTCWEDPRLDQQVLDLGPDDVVMVITSAGCNALDYLLRGPAAVHAVDMNPRQNALLELKAAAARAVDHDTFFALFGEGRLDGAGALYRATLREHLTPGAARFWDRRIRWFEGDSFYWHGTTGRFARVIKAYIDRVAHLRPQVEAMLGADSLEAQRRIYDEEFAPRFWRPSVRRSLGWGAVLAMLGVPEPQRIQLEQTCGGLPQFVEDRVNHVLRNTSLRDNYFWRLYLDGKYTRDCCPDYLRAEHFDTLRASLDRLQQHTATIEQFARAHDGQISRFVLLDHMDWLCTAKLPLLQAEWQAMLDRAAPDARFLWRSGGARTPFVDRLEVDRNGRKRVGDLLRYWGAESERLHADCRVNTYGSFHVAELIA